jgi:ABC-type branched-subunit amino acid transport system substrate-binding protein
MAMTRRRSPFAVAACGACVLFGLAACSSSKKASSTTAGTSSGATSSTGASAAASKYPPIPPGPIRFGVSVPLSGATASYGLGYKAAYGVTLSFFNQQHPDGIDGHPIQFDVLDDGSDVTKAVNVANQFVANKDAAVVVVTANPLGTPQQLAILNKAKVPVLSQMSDNQYTDPTKWPYVFGNSYSNIQAGQKAAAWIATHSDIKKIGVLSDGTQTQQEVVGDILNSAKTAAPGVQVVKTVQVSPGSVDVSTAIAQLKAANPDLLIVGLGFGFGPVWQAMQAASFSPQILTSPGAFYDGYNAMGPLADKGVVYYVDCVQPSHAPFEKTLTDLMDAYHAVPGTSTINLLAQPSYDSAPMEILKYAIEKYHSVDPDAIKQAIEGMGPRTFYGAFQYDYTPTNHFGMTGDLGPNMCSMKGFIDGKYMLPTIAS